MLETLRIQNYALIDEVELELRPGLVALSGETGAGKSIILGALNMVLGARASNELVREGAKSARIDAVFRFPDGLPERLARILHEHEIELDQDEFLVSRTITAEGRSRAYIEGRLVPVSVLSEVGDELVDLHGQHEHQSLLRVDRQLDLLDAFADAQADAARVAELTAELRGLDRRIEELESVDRERERRLEFLRFEVSEIDQAGLEIGEEEELRSRRNLIANAEAVVRLSGQAYGALYEADGQAAVDAIGIASAAADELAALDERFAAFVQQLDQIRNEIDSIATELRAFIQEVDYDPAELDQINQRLMQIANLRRKYGDSIEEILAYRAQAAEEIAGYDQRDARLAELRKRRADALAEAQAAAEALSNKRRDAAAKLGAQVTEILRPLGMKAGAFAVRIDRVDLCADGIDRIEYMLAANAGERPKPLRQVASGGEISRVMLALKTVFARADGIPTLVFDEIDAGVGGVVANRVADTLRQLAETHQTICITHLAQIAAVADTHFRVEKVEEDGRSRSTVRPLRDKERVEEVARLLDGSVSDVSVKHARSLLKPRG